LVDVAHEVIIREEDCGTTEGLTISKHDKGRTSSLGDRVQGRILAANVTSKTTKKIILKTGDELDEAAVALLNEHEVEEATVRSALTASFSTGLCKKCYGWDLSTKKIAQPVSQ